VNIYSISGRMVSSLETAKQAPTMDQVLYVGNLPSGVYVVEVVIGTSTRITTKLVKQ
jgi:Secretion system C-terminal sorting domain